MSNRFRASLVHPGCVLAVAIVVAFADPCNRRRSGSGGCGNERLRAPGATPYPQAWTSRTFIAHRKPSDTRIGGPSSSVTLKWGRAKRRQRRRT